MSTFMPSAAQLSNDSGLNQSKFKQNMSFLKKESGKTFRLLPFTHVPDGFGPVELDFHQNFSAPMTTKEGKEWRTAVRCRRGLSGNKESCSACALAAAQKKAAGGRALPYKEDISRSLSFFVVVYEVSETFDRKTNVVQYDLDVTKPVVLELYRAQYIALTQSMSDYLSKLWRAECERLALENKLPAGATEEQLAEVIGEQALKDRRAEIAARVEQISPTDPTQGVIFKMDERMVAGTNSDKPQKHWFFEPITDPTNATNPVTSLPMPTGWEDEASKFKSLSERYPAFSNSDLEHLHAGNFHLMDDSRFVPKNRDAATSGPKAAAGGITPRPAGIPPVGIRPTAGVAPTAGIRPPVSPTRPPVGTAPSAGIRPPVSPTRPPVDSAPSAGARPPVGSDVGWASKAAGRPAPESDEE